MPIFGIGTWQMGGRFERDKHNDDARDIGALREAIERGITHIDTAESYADGKAEELVGQAIKHYDREKLFVVSKVSGWHMHEKDVVHSCEQSLKRLGTDYLDLYLLHRHNADVPLAETMNALNALHERGLIRNLGLSNFTKEAHAEAAACAASPIMATQVHYNLKFREPATSGLLDYCQEHDTMLIAWRPLGKGEQAQQGTSVVDELCEKYGKTPAQIAINWLVAQENVVTLAKTSNHEHFEENLGALGWNMEANDVERLRQEYPGQKTVSDTVPLG